MAVLRDFTFLTGTSIGSDSFCNVLLCNVFLFPNFGRIFGVPEVWWMFRLLQTVLFLTDSVLMHSLLVLMNLSIYISVLSHEKVILQ